MKFLKTMKFFKTVRIVFVLLMARTFGSYKFSGWNGHCHYCVYEFWGKVWFVPLSDYTETT